MKEYLNPDQGYKLVNCGIGSTQVPSNWIEIPECADFALMFDSIELCFYKKDNPTLLLWNKYSKKWTDTNYEKMESVPLNVSVDIVWQRDSAEEKKESGRVKLLSDEDRELLERDNVNSPSHYNKGSVECIYAIESSMTKEAFCGYLKGNVIKYMYRYEDKGGVESLQKAQWYLNKLINLESM